jgi:hypothetical protein
LVVPGFLQQIHSTIRHNDEGKKVGSSFHISIGWNLQVVTVKGKKTLKYYAVHMNPTHDSTGLEMNPTHNRTGLHHGDDSRACTKHTCKGRSPNIKDERCLRLS